MTLQNNASISSRPLPTADCSVHLLGWAGDRLSGEGSGRLWMLGNRLFGGGGSGSSYSGGGGFSAYGQVIGRHGEMTTPFQWHGSHGVMTEDNGLVHMRARYDHPVLSRFLSEDPIRFEGGLNWYGYADGNPISNMDPSGNVVETMWDVANLGMGAASLGSNLWDGNYGWAAFDAVGLIYDGVATAVPFLPAGASAGFKAARVGNSVVNSIQVGSDVARIADRTHDAARAMDAGQITRQQAANAGTQLHSTTGNLSDNFVSGFAGSHRASGMPDMNWNNVTGIWGDVTTNTVGSWAAHERRYGSLGEGIGILYQRGVGVTNMTRMSTGAGVGLGLLQQGSNYMNRK